ncbi:unnamed protein product [Cylindrotheca closterium]|uniref:DNA helicase n=1 Tax=Cylindrotheca closterium TaxID=2856 RepID=A0AAD2FIZ9_9STRA|nr:unnamed protein product [Cylindrotheca closterium]
MKAVKPSNNARRKISPLSDGANTANSGSAAAKSAVTPATTIDLRGVQVHFPFKPYACQEDYMGKVLDALHRSENALLESPTGTGKTLCLLCSALAWQKEQARLLQQQTFADPSAANPTKKAVHRVPTIIYASRTHSQLSQVVRELQNTRYRPKHAVLGSREQMCVNPKVKKATSTASEINHDCNKLCKERKCRYRNKLEGFQPPPNESGLTSNDQPIMDIEDIVAMGKTHKVCSFYYTRSKVEEADLIFVPYNYLFDNDARTTTLAEVAWDNAVIIFDEAHNLESFASESASFDLSTLDISRCIQEVSRALNYVENIPEQENKIKKENILRLKSIFLCLEEHILTMENEAAHKGEFMMEIFRRGASISHANHDLFIREVKKLVDIFLEVQGGNNKGAPGLQHLIQCVKRVFGEQTEARCIAKAQSYRVHISPKQNSNAAVGRTVSYWCFAPSEAMRELAALKVRSILVTSGTLSPLESYAMELDIPFPNRIENPHIIKDDQVHVRVVGRGVTGKLLSSSYERRQDKEYYTELGNTLVSLSRVIPAGMLIFFPSYSVMQACIEKWGGPANSRQSGGKPVSSFFGAKKKQSTRYSFPHTPTAFSTSKETLTPWKRLLGNKAVVLEPRSTADLQDAIAEFHKFLNMPKSKGVVLMGVCRGKISEGIDFAHDMCRAVVITGLPFAPSFDPKVKMKREFLDCNKRKQNMKSKEDGGFGAKTADVLSGHEWYTQQAHRAVNQAIGRVIRNRVDYGAVLLLDSRFGMPANKQGLSKWVRPHILDDEGMGKTISSLAKFYKEAAVKVEQRKLSIPTPRLEPNKVSVILKYEDEGKEDMQRMSDENKITKVAIIRKADGTAMLASGNETSAGADSTFVSSNDIIARIDTKGTGSRDFRKLVRTEDKALNYTDSNATTAVRLKDAMAAQASQSEASGTISSGTQNGISPAKTFFLKLQTCMSKGEIATMKKQIFTMKRYVDIQHRKPFMASASAAIDTILRHENFENRSRTAPPELVSLLFRLLPSHYRDDCEMVTLNSVYRQSAFGKQAKSMLTTDKYREHRSSLLKILKLIWFEDEASQKSSFSTLTKEFESHLVRLVEANPGLDPGSVRGCKSFLPLECHSAIDSLIHKIADVRRASMGMHQMKESEKRLLNQELMSTQQTPPDNTSKTSASRQINSTQDDSKQGTVAANGISLQKARGFPIDDRKKRLNAVAKGVLKSAKRPKNAFNTSSLLSPLSKNPYRKAIHQSESRMFTGRSNFNGLHNIKSNAPDSLACPICEKKVDKPYIAECGHIACISCWSQWLKKNSTCPSCRKPTKMESLAVAVFKSA